MPKAQNLVLTQSQASCLIALRHGNENQPMRKQLVTPGKCAREGSAESQPVKKTEADEKASLLTGKGHS